MLIESQRSVPVDDEDACNYVKNGRYGPVTVDKFCMDLPLLFPTTAGQASAALNDHLVRYEKMKINAEKNRVRTAAELRKEKQVRLDKKKMPEWLKRIVKPHKSEEALLGKRLEADVTLFKLTESVYMARRKHAMGVLPGLGEHYPNIYYDSGAVVPLDLSYAHPPNIKSGWTSMFKSKASLIQERDDVLKGAVGRGKKLNANEPKSPGDNKFDDGNAQLHNADDKTVEKAYMVGHKENNATESETKKSRETDKIAVDNVDEISSLGDGVDSNIQLAQNSSSALNMKVTGLKNDEIVNRINAGFTMNRKGFPNGVYMERRGSFPHAPGLETMTGLSLRETQANIIATANNRHLDNDVAGGQGSGVESMRSSKGATGEFSGLLGKLVGADHISQARISKAKLKGYLKEMCASVWF